MISLARFSATVGAKRLDCHGKAIGIATRLLYWGAVGGSLFLLTGRRTEAQTPATPLSLSSATVYVYRQAHMLGLATHWPVFVNVDYLADLHNGTYMSKEVPEGTVVLGELCYHTGAMHWPRLLISGSGCDGMDWKRTSSTGNVGGCLGELLTAQTTLAQFREAGKLKVLKTPDQRLRVCGPHPSLKWHLTEVDRCSDEVKLALELLPPRGRLKFEAEAGKTYYVKVSIPMYSTTHLPRQTCLADMKLVDAATGTTETSGLHLTPDK